ncbi:hypothetical protein V6N12_056604 [Hibiscus sabdariffa]|uniref:Reverse transcriptase zinc-binding domain-containing protein n=1 Tax=Hibiscus sabdariffa TaxID=183260 RepID=A0ABR2CT06_9ROSI
MQILQRHFTDSAIAHIIGIRCPDPLDENDCAMWRWTSRHNFELKSAYLRLDGSHWPPRQAIWKLIWRMAVPQRIRLFLWLAFQQRLMTNATRHCRNFAPSPTCPLCCSLRQFCTLCVTVPRFVIFGHRSCRMLSNVLSLGRASMFGYLSDCRQAIDLIYSAEAPSSALSLVQAITRLRRMDWEVTIIWVPRDANRAADTMAKLADPSDYSLRVFHVAPLETGIQVSKKCGGGVALNEGGVECMLHESCTVDSTRRIIKADEGFAAVGKAKMASFFQK